MKTALVTGGCGFIGSQVVRELESRGWRVAVLDCLTYAGNPKNLEGTGAKLFTADVRDPHEVRRVLRESSPQAVFHLAADSHVQRSFSDGRRFLETNAIGTENILDAACAQLIRRVLHVSTDEVFGDVLVGNADEDSAIRPRNPYAASKAAAEGIVWSYRNWKNFPITMVRLSNCYGPRQHAEKLVPATIARLVAGLGAIIHGDGKQVRDWLHVNDAAHGIVDALEHGAPGSTFNLPGGCELSVRDIVALITRQVAPSLYPFFSSDRPGAADRRYGMIGPRAVRQLQWYPRVDLDKGLRATVEWYLSNRERVAEAA